MKNRRLLCALLTLMLTLSLFLPAALAVVESVPLGDREGFSVELPDGWISMNENLQNSSILGYSPAAMYDYAGGRARAFVLHFSGFTGEITLEQVARYLEVEKASRTTELNGQEVLEAYVQNLSIFGIAFLDLDATGYYVIGMVPGVAGTLDDQTVPVQEFYHAIRFGEAAPAAPSADPAVGTAVGKGSALGFGGPVDVTVLFDGSTILSVEIDPDTFAETPGMGGAALDPAFLGQFAGKTVPLSSSEIDALTGATVTTNAVVEAVNDAHAHLNPLDIAELRQMLEQAQADAAAAQAIAAAAQTALADAQARADALQAQLDAALEKNTCKNCGYTFPEDAPFQFCPICGTPR